MCDHPVDPQRMASVVAGVVALQAHMGQQPLSPVEALDVLISTYLNTAHTAGLRLSDVVRAFAGAAAFYEAVFPDGRGAPIAATSTIQ